MIKQGLGLSLNGRELRVALLQLDGQNMRVDSLETVQLPAFDAAATSYDVDDVPSPDISELESLGNGGSISTDESNSSVDIAAQLVHSMIEKHAEQKIRVGLNLPTTEVRYEETTDVEVEQAPRQSWLEKLRMRKHWAEPPKNEFIMQRCDNSNLKVILETSTPFLLSLLEKQNVFLKGHLVFSAMLPNELALLKLCRRSALFEDPNKVTIIIQVEDDFSHLIFLKGKDFRSATPFFGEFEGEGLLNLLYSKIIYELDHWQVDDIDAILLASNAANEKTLKFFQEKLPGTMVSYIISSDTNLGLSSKYSFDELSQYSLPIALAWQTFDCSRKNCGASNMLPQRIFDSQKALKLSTSGVLLLAILGISTLGLTLALLNKRLVNYKLARENAFFEMELKANEPIVAEVQMLTGEIAKLAQVTTLADSLIESYDDVLTFLQQANNSLSTTNDSWINAINNTEKGFKIIGQTRNREAIPVLSSVLGHSIIRRVYKEYDGESVYSYEIDLNWPSNPVMLPTPSSEPAMQFAQKFEQPDKQPDYLDLSMAQANEEILLRNAESPQSRLQGMKYYQPSEPDSHLNTGIFTIILERIADFETASDFVQQIQMAGYDVFLRQADDQYFICTETFARRADAEKKLSRLQQQNVPNAEIVDIHRYSPVPINTNYAQSSSEFLENTAGSDLDRIEQLPKPNAPVLEEKYLVDVVAPTVDMIQSEFVLGPPTPEVEIAVEESLPAEETESWAMADRSESEIASTRSSDSQMSLDRSDYFFSDDYEKKGESPKAEVGINSSLNRSDYAIAPDTKADQSQALDIVTQDLHHSLSDGKERIEFRLTERESKILILASDHLSSKSAMQDAEQLDALNIETTILDLRVQGKPKPFWVCLGEYDTMYAAKSAITELNQRTERNYKVKILDQQYYLPYQKPTEPI